MLDKMERKFGKYAIKNLPLIIIMTYAIGYILQAVNPYVLNYIYLDPYLVSHGEVWRLVTWLLIPPQENNLFFMLIMLYFYYSLSLTLEKTWGEFYFNYYIFTGILFTILGTFAFMGYCYLTDPYEVLNDLTSVSDTQATAILKIGGIGGKSEIGHFGDIYRAFGVSKDITIQVLCMYCGTMVSTYYISMSILLAFAATFPDMPIFLFFILPLKIKVLGIIYGAILVYEAISLLPMGPFVIGSALLNFIIFFLTTKKSRKKRNQKILRQFVAKKQEENKKREQYKATTIAKHKCAICGRTSETHPDIDFRFCSKCEGNYEYCNEHLFTHEHVKR